MKFKDLIRSRHSACFINPIVRIMKLTILLITTFLLQVSAATVAQKITFSKKNASLKQLFIEIRKQTGYNVFWQEDKVNQDLKINAAFKNAALEDVLTAALNPQSLTYTIINKTVVVKEKEETIFDKVKAIFSAVNVEGKIQDAETGLPIPAVNINLKGSKRTVSADERGNFRFNALPDHGILLFSAIGYVSQEVPVAESMVVKMVMATQKLSEVVVSNGYQQIKQGSTTGSYSVITAKDIESTPSVNLMERLEGKVPGVHIDLRNNTIQVRGVNSYSPSSPLIIIDGFPAINQSLTTITSGSINSSPTFKNQPATSGNAILSTFNPDDIESITFLKDAAASSIWGASAANGVIVEIGRAHV